MAASSRQLTVAVLRLDHIGDLVLTGPFLVELRKAYPTARILLVVTTTVAELARRLSVVDEVLAVPDRRTRWFGRVRRAADGLRLARRLRRRAIDVIIVPRWDLDHYGAIAIARRSRAPVRLGFTHAAIGSNAKSLTSTVDAPADEQEALKPLRLLPSGHQHDWADLEHPVWYAPEDAAVADSLLASADRPLIVFGIGADEARKVWPAERFAMSALALCETFDALAVVIGSRDDGAAAARFAAIAPQCLNLAGATTLPVAAAVIARAVLFVGNDAGPMHLAAAAQVPIVEIRCHPQSGPRGHRYSPARFGPRPGPAVTLQPVEPADGCGESCAASDSHCILAVSVEDVVFAARQLLGAASGRLGS